MERCLPADSGCWIDGHWGQYAVERLLSIAKDLGWGYDIRADIEINGEDAIFDLADEAEAWLNEEIAPEGHQFGWSSGEFFLMPHEWWMEQDF